MVGVAFTDTQKSEYLSLIRFLFIREHVAMTDREKNRMPFGRFSAFKRNGEGTKGSASQMDEKAIARCDRYDRL